MPTALTTLFGRDFLIGFFIPAIIFVVLSLMLVMSFNLGSEFLNGLHLLILEITGAGPATGGRLLKSSGEAAEIISIGHAVIIFISLSWLLGILLLAVNYKAYRFLEGYGRMNPLRPLIFFRRKAYEKLNEKVDDLQARVEAETDPERRRRLMQSYGEALSSLVDRFPDARDFLLPTKFGNTIRAFEVYPRVMYGIEGTTGWTRLVAVIPKEYLALIESAKAQVDFWINLLIIVCATVIEYLFLSYHVHGERLEDWPVKWMIIVLLLSILLFNTQARHAASSWGQFVKSAFDLFLPDLKKKLEPNFSVDLEEERKRWTSFSQASTWHQPEAYPDSEAPAAAENQRMKKIQLFSCGFIIGMAVWQKILGSRK